MRTHSRCVTLGAAAIAVVLGFGASAAQAQNKCLAGKTKCVNKKAAGLLKCNEKCQKDPAKCGGVQTTCEDKVRAKFDGGGVKLGCFDKFEAKNDGPCVTFGDRAAMETRVDVFVNGTVTTLEGGAAAPCTAFPATGQTTCWNSSGSVIPCAGTGHDGNIQAGATLAYQDNGDGTITDLNTGLTWEKKSDDGSINDKDTTRTWSNAFAAHVAGLNSGGGFAGHIDWRVPNVKELQSIVNYENSYPAVSAAFNNNCTPGCTVLTCSCTVSNFYWSSTTNENNPNNAWNVNFNDGNVNANNKTNNNYVRAVRGGSCRRS